MAIGGHSEDEQQLLEIGPVCLRMAVGDGRRGATAHSAPGCLAEVSAKTDRGAVVVKFIKTKAKALRHSQHHIGKKRCAVRIEEVIQRTPEPVVAEVFHLLLTQAKHAAGKPVHGFLLAVDGFTLDDQRAQQDPKRSGMRDGTSTIAGDMPVQRLLQSDAINEVIDHRQRTQALALEIEAGLLRGLSLHSFHSGVIINARMKNVKHYVTKT